MSLLAVAYSEHSACADDSDEQNWWCLRLWRRTLRAVRLIAGDSSEAGDARPRHRFANTASAASSRAAWWRLLWPWAPLSPPGRSRAAMRPRLLQGRGPKLTVASVPAVARALLEDRPPADTHHLHGRNPRLRLLSLMRKHHMRCRQQAERVVVQQMLRCPPRNLRTIVASVSSMMAQPFAKRCCCADWVASGVVEVVARTQDSAARQCQQTVCFMKPQSSAAHEQWQG